MAEDDSDGFESNLSWSCNQQKREAHRKNDVRFLRNTACTETQLWDGQVNGVRFWKLEEDAVLTASYSEEMKILHRFMSQLLFPHHVFRGAQSNNVL